MSITPQHIAAHTTHRRSGAIGRSFTYSVDYVLIDPKSAKTPLLFSRNRLNLMSVHDRHHGGKRGKGTGVSWAEREFESAGIREATVLLLTQPRFLGYIFNPVSFWLALRDGELVAAIAEVNNTFGDRHSYMCKPADSEPITPETTLNAQKMMHVSPFQEVKGEYSFNFNVLYDFLHIRIRMDNGNEVLFADLRGHRRPLTNLAIVKALLRRPFGPLRTIGLIYWQALRLKLRGAPYRTRPAPPTVEISG
jgi:DUF1365 family protein